VTKDAAENHPAMRRDRIGKTHPSKPRTQHTTDAESTKLKK
jgi:hypothetical protein